MQHTLASAPYSASWIDRLNGLVERLPGPAWLAYAVALVVLVLVANAAAWVDVSQPIGAFDPYLSALAVYPILPLAAIPYLDASASAALDRMRPALALDDSQVESLRYRLTTMPDRETLLWTLVGIMVATGYVAFGLAIPVRHGGPATRAVDIAIAFIGFPMLAVLFFHTVRQVRIISSIHEQIRRIDVFHLAPVHAFAGVTARSGLVLLGLAYVSAATDPTTFVLANPALAAFLVAAIVVAIAVFVVPMMGTHRRIVEEKERLAEDAGDQLHRVVGEISRRVRKGDLNDADALNKQLASVTTQREVIARIPSWPWDTTTLRGFATAVILPIALWLVFRLLERLIG